MTLPQTNSTKTMLKGYEVWRLFTTLESSGDIYENELPGRAFVIGPDSDVDRIRVVYLNEVDPPVLSSQNVSQISISTSRPYIGRLNAAPAADYNAFGDKGRLLFSPLDLMPPAGFRPPSAGVNDLVALIQPKIDLVMYLKEVPTNIGGRSDKTFLLEQLPDFTSTNPQWFLVPFYGRKNATVTVKSLGILGQPAITVRVNGINFSNIINSALVSDNGHAERLLSTISIIAPGLGAGLTNSATVLDRPYDFLAIEIDSGGSAFPSAQSVSVNIRMSDQS